MTLAAVTQGAPAPVEAAPAPEATEPPAQADARAKAAERARKHRALKKLKAAKTEEQLKAVAAEVAAPAEEPAPSWPTGEEIAAAAAQLAPALEQGMELIAGTPWELSERKAKLLVMTLAPAAAQSAKNPGAGALAKYVSPTMVALVGLALVFGPPTVREIRALVGSPRPTPTPKEEPPSAAP